MISTKILLINAPNLFDSKINDFHAIKWDTSGVLEATNTREVLPPSQIIRRLTFLAPSLITRLIQKICANIVKFKSFLKNFY